MRGMKTKPREVLASKAGRSEMRRWLMALTAECSCEDAGVSVSDSNGTICGGGGGDGPSRVGGLAIGCDCQARRPKGGVGWSEGRGKESQENGTLRI